MCEGPSCWDLRRIDWARTLAYLQGSSLMPSISTPMKQFTSYKYRKSRFWSCSWNPQPAVHPRCQTCLYQVLWKMLESLYPLICAFQWCVQKPGKGNVSEQRQQVTTAMIFLLEGSLACAEVTPRTFVNESGLMKTSTKAILRKSATLAQHLWKKYTSNC